MKFTQPVLVQKLEDEYIEEFSGRASVTPSVAGQLLVKRDDSRIMSMEKTTRYRPATATLMYIMQYSRPEIYNTRHRQTIYMK